MLKNNNRKILIAISAAIVTLMMVSLALPAVSQSFGSYSGGAQYLPSVTGPPYNITLQEKGLPNGTDWQVRGYNGGTYGYDYSTTQYINYTDIYNGSYYFTVYGYSTSTNTYSPNPGSFTLYVSGSNVEETISFSNTTVPSSPQQYQLNLSISNMPVSIPGSPQWTWTVTVTGVNVLYYDQYTTTYPVIQMYGLTNGTYNYQAQTSGSSSSSSNVYGTAISPPSGQFTVSGKNVVLSFKLSFLSQYNVKFTESGLPTTQSFYVYLDSVSLGQSVSNQTYISNGNSVNFKLLDGTYYYTVYAGSGSYTASPSQGTITVSGSAVTVGISFKLTTSSYSVLFKISNPPANLKGSLWDWYLNLNGSGYYSYNSTLSLNGLHNGTYFFEVYGYGITFSTSFGSFTVSGKNTVVTLKVESSYTVMFRLHNLSGFATGPPEISAVITNTASGNIYEPSSSNGTLILGNIPNGTYQYYLTVPPPYSLNITSGTFTVNGTGVTISLSGTEGSVYLVQFVESGIPLWGSSWGIVVDNGFTYNDTYTSPYLSTTNSPLPYVLDIPNGTYTVQGFIYYNGHYHFTAPHTVQVSGKSLNVSIAFSSTGPGSSAAGAYNGLYLLVALALAVVVVAGVAVYFVRKKKNGGS